MLAVLAAIVHTGEISFVEDDSNNFQADKSKVKNIQELLVG